ncbi:adenylate/guanylate cyclase domain-containing protein [Mycolicibacterium sp. F2034L]|uniref:adenylate/guanylate cyclase domain-containing protein n=1 Tax=Mycolicibacterium sp. F2034L TaxID=2926422 RepID=UPI001FF2E976|nr:adenylate/guanylate cyclase domain-containing protein [Mycolicibacterium sp. F2034L]MCK0173163.1 adenylate/guanylate cyclase domain-containing protein [Mycolicibacterium sp. F2034L]
MTEVENIESAGLLDGLSGKARDERAELIQWLMQRGITAEEIREAVAPMLLASRRLIGDDGVYVSAREISEKYGVDLELLQRFQRAMGLSRVDDPDAAVHLRADVEAAAGAQRFIRYGLDADQVIQVLRVLSEGLAKTAEVMRYTAFAAILTPGATELELAQASEALVREIAPMLSPMISEMLLLQLRHSMETEAVTAAERAEGVPLPGARMVSVLFADLVGFTRLGEAVPPEELEQLARRLGDLARELAVAPVHFVKTIGDAVMLVSTEPAALLELALNMLDATDTVPDFPRLRIGIATGEAVSRVGDWFGSPVNLASRVTGAARPGTVLVAETTREAVGDDDRFSWSFAGARHLKGLKGDTKLFRARRP